VCRAFEEYGNEKAAEARKEKAVEVAKKLLQDGFSDIGETNSDVFYL